jgi:hypothetical protein
MQASIENQPDGTIALHLDLDAARAAFASIIFASRFHRDIAPLARIVEEKWNPDKRGCDSGRTACR